MLLRGRNNRILFAACVERYSFARREWYTEILYLHAKDSNEAKIRFTAGHTQELIGNWPDLQPSMRVVGIAPAIGVFADHGKKDGDFVNLSV